MKKSTLLFLLTLIAQSLFSQLIAPFQISNDTEIFDSPDMVFPADLDNDGDIDLVTQSIFNGNIVWYENLDGQGGMDNPKVIVSLGNFGVDFIRVFDIDNDGVLDVLGMNNGEMFWVKNTIKATATFSDLIFFPVTDVSFGYEAEMIDINGDEILDIILIGASLSIKWLEGIDGKGNFHPSEELINNGRYRMEIADFDLDGDMDIVSLSYINSEFGLGWFENLDGQGNFGSIQSIDLVTGFSDDLQVADFDLDGDLDVLLGGGTNTWNRHFYFWYENKLNEVGSWTKKIVSDVAIIAPPTIFDLDADGDLDLITTDDGLRVFENTDGQGTFVAGDTLGVIGGFSLTNADVNGDNIQDVISIYRTGTVNQELGLLYFGRSNGTFENPLDFMGDFDFGFGVAKDINRDGVNDLLSSHSNINRIDWQFFDNSQLKFSNPRIIDDVQARDFDSADFDGDGIEDLVICTQNIGGDDAQVIWYKKLDDNINFGPPRVLFSANHDVQQVFATDLDNDGDIDLVFNKPSDTDTGVHWLENLDGQGNFSSFQTLNSSSFDLILVEDMDLDGDLDIFGYDDGLNEIYYLENSSMNFNDPFMLLEADVRKLELEDLDGNGWKDLIYIQSNNTVSVNLNNGGIGDYAPAIDFVGITPFQNIQMYIRDIDQDGDADLMIAELGNNEYFLYLFEHIGGPNLFENKRAIYYQPERYSQCAFGDFNGDKDFDMVLSRIATKAAYFVENFEDLPVISGKVFLDLNEDSNQDVGEPIIFPNSVVVEPDELTSLLSGNGAFSFLVDPGEYDITCNVSPDFLFTTPSTISISINDTSNVNICFGIFPERDALGTTANITSAPTRCGFQVPFWLDYQNTGTVIGNVVVALRVDTLASFLFATPEPDSIVDDRIYWSHQNLLPTHSGQIQVLLQMPGVEALGEFLSFNNTTFIQSIDSTYFAIKSVGYRPEINCAYDPNDKTVEPNIPGHENFTLFGDTLDYVVRFQNTGTDTAFTVVIEDYLDKDLDYSSLDVLGASHPHKATLDQETGRLLFVFENILLPDSTTNEIASHGFFRYRILPKTGLSEDTYIQNYASIFFDFNPPILTNTVENILVSNYPLLVDIVDPICADENEGSLTILFDSPFYNSIEWSSGDNGLMADSLSPGEYDLTIVYLDGSQLDTSFVLNPPIPVLVNSNSTPEFNQTANGTITITTSGGQPPYTYSWDHDPTETGNFLTSLSAGDYMVTVTDENSCTEVVMITVDQLTNVQSLHESVRLAVSPNPNNGIFTVDFAFENTMNWQLKVTNSLGQIMKEIVAPSGGTTDSKLEFELTNGVYWISLLVDGKVVGNETIVVE